MKYINDAFGRSKLQHDHIIHKNIVNHQMCYIYIYIYIYKLVKDKFIIFDITIFY